jgi:selenocysteine lyase/cysteine desulfurase
MDRRSFVQASVGALMVTRASAQGQPGVATPDLPALWDVDRSIANLENAYWGVMPREVADEYLTQTQFLNRRNVVFARDALAGQERTVAMERARAQVAALMGAPADEFAFTRNGTESLQNLIMQYGKLRPGDAVLYADLDYDEMQQAMESLRHYRGATVLRFSIPEPTTTANILTAYAQQLKAAPASLKLLLVTHLSNRTGLVMPVKEIVAMARARGVDTIVDAAQTIGHLHFTLADLDADFVGFSLHKWLCAPLGTGAIWIRKSRLADIEPCMGSMMFPADDTRSRSSVGTVNFAATMTIPAAIAFHNRIGGVRKQAHLQALRSYWVERVRDIQGLQILTPNDPARYGAVTSFRLPRMKDYGEAQAMARLLLDKYRILTVARRGIANGAAVRVTPTLYNTHAELDRLVSALRIESPRFL